jgi:tRNA (guanine-N7-)-methyltransferase
MNCQQIHCYHPQPYYTRTDIRKRLITPDFLSMVYTSLIDQGQFIIQTDHLSYWNYFEQIIPEFFDFTPHPEPWEDAPLGRTRREILARSQNLPIYRGVATKTKILTPAQLTSLTKKLPWPRFNADRRYQKYDQLERE